MLHPGLSCDRKGKTVQFVDIDKLFALRHNRNLQRVAKFTKKKLAGAAAAKNKFSRSHAGGKEPAAARSSTKPKTQEERIAAGARFLKQNK